MIMADVVPRKGGILGFNSSVYRDFEQTIGTDQNPGFIFTIDNESKGLGLRGFGKN
jgi:hypothetical protein